MIACSCFTRRRVFRLTPFGTRNLPGSEITVWYGQGNGYPHLMRGSSRSGRSQNRRFGAGIPKATIGHLGGQRNLVLAKVPRGVIAVSFA